MRSPFPDRAVAPAERLSDAQLHDHRALIIGTSGQGSDGQICGSEAQDGRVSDIEVQDGRISESHVAHSRIPHDRIPDRRIPDRRIPDSRISDGQAEHGRIPDGLFSDSSAHDGRISDSDAQDERITDSHARDVRIPDSRITDSQIPNGRIPDSQIPDTRISDGRIPDSRIPDGRIPDSRISDGRISDDRISDDRIPDSRITDSDERDSQRQHAALLECGIAVAFRTPGWTFIELVVSVQTPASLIAAWPAPAVVWSSSELKIVGLGVALELRGCGDARWSMIARAATALGTVARVGVATDKLARPRFVGGAAFAPGAADRSPWTGFGDAWFMLPRWTYVHEGDQARLVLAVDANDARDAARWHRELAMIQAALAGGITPQPQPPVISLDRGDIRAWHEHVRAISDAIARDDCAKIVAARSATVTLADDVRIADLLASLDLRHADCVRLLVRPPGGGVLLAATPERLVCVDGTRVSCDAFAGSRALSDEYAERTLLASSKDRREHELVVRAIVAALRELGGAVDPPAEPRVCALRHVLHLHTPIRATLATHHHLLDVAARIHPTPAVGGTPTGVASDWIAKHEPVHRGWYAAPIGWFDLDGNGELAVAIRSGLVDGKRAHLWAGAGIVGGSDPDSELAETEVKLRAMLDALGVLR